MHTLAGKDVLADEVVDRTQEHGATAHLISKRRHAQVHAFASIALGLAIERLMLPVLLEHDHGEQARPCKAARQNVEGGWWLRYLLAIPAGELLAHVLHDLPLSRYDFQCFGDVLAKLVQFGRTAARAGGRARHDHAFAWQVRGERLSGGLIAREGANHRRIVLGGLFGDEFVFGGCGFKLFEFKLHLVDEARLALVTRPKNLAL